MYVLVDYMDQKRTKYTGVGYGSESIYISLTKVIFSRIEVSCMHPALYSLRICNNALYLGILVDPVYEG